MSPISLKKQNINLFITDNHNEVFYHWVKSGLRHSMLLHIDAHPDSCIPKAIPIYHNDFELKRYTELLNVNEFIWPAMFNGIVDRFYYYNPYEYPNQIIYLGGILDNPRLEARVYIDSKCWYTGDIPEDNSYVLINVEEIESNLPIILDTDLDAFACDFDGYF